MNRMILIIVLALMSFAASAVPVPGPNPSGVYLSSDKACLVSISRSGPQLITLVACLHFNGRFTSSLNNLHAPNTCRSDSPVPLDPAAWDDFVSLREFSVSRQDMKAIRGADYGTVSNGIGYVETWFLMGAVQTNYTCSATVARWKP